MSLRICGEQSALGEAKLEDFRRFLTLSIFDLVAPPGRVGGEVAPAKVGQATSSEN